VSGEWAENDVQWSKSDGDAGVVAGIYTGYDEACNQVVRWSDAVYSPDQAAV